jgi:hypothetical protein
MAILEQPVNNYDPFADRVGQTLAPAGTFVATIEDIIDELRVQRKKYQSEEIETVDLTCFLFRIQDQQGRVHRISSRRMKISGHEKSTLFGFLKSILGRAPRMGWDYLELRGHSCLVTIEHIPRRNGEGEFAGIASLSPVPAGMANGQSSLVTGGSAEGGGGKKEEAKAEGPSVEGDPSTPEGYAGTGEELPY